MQASRQTGRMQVKRCIQRKRRDKEVERTGGGAV